MNTLLLLATLTMPRHQCDEVPSGTFVMASRLPPQPLTRDGREVPVYRVRFDPRAPTKVRISNAVPTRPGHWRPTQTNPDFIVLVVAWNRPADLVVAPAGNPVCGK